MKKLNRCLVWLTGASVTLVAASAAMAGGATLSCPAQANAGSSIMVNMSFENDDCVAKSVRIMASIVGNASNTLGGVGIFGPVVAVPVVTVPAGTNRFCGCSASICQCDFNVTCSTDADCKSCTASTQGTQNAFFDTTLDIPNSLVGTVSTHVIISESDSGTDVQTEINECFVEVL